MSDSIDALVQKINSLTDPAISTAIEASRAEAYASLGHDVTAIVIGVAFGFGAMVAWKRIPEDYGEGIMRPVSAILLGTIATIVVLVGAAGLMDPWLYISMVHPELWLAKSLLNL